MEFVTIDLNTGRVVGSRVVGDEEISASYDLFRNLIIPILKELSQKKSKRAYRNFGNGRCLTVWVTRLFYVGGRVEFKYSFRYSWEANQERFKNLLMTGFTFREFRSGRLRSPWVINLPGLTEVFLSDTAVTLAVGDDERLRGLSNGS